VQHRVGQHRPRCHAVCGQAGRTRPTGWCDWSADAPHPLRVLVVKVLTACRRHELWFCITVRQSATVTTAIAAIDETAWTSISHPDASIAQVAETTLGCDRLIG
jgi:hypothetical protein